MRLSTKITIGAVIGIGAATLIGGGIALAADGGGSDPEETETPITGDALVYASAAALAYTGEGAVSGTEASDEESYYEVEVTLNDGTQVDVQLDEAFEVVGADADSETDD